MPGVWFAIKKSLQCKSEATDVYDPKSSSNLSTTQTRKQSRFGCSRSLSNLRDVIHGSKRHTERPCSPRSVGSSDFLNPITHEVILNDSKCELKITRRGGEGGSTFVGTLRPGTPGPGDHKPKRSNTPSRKIHGGYPIFGGGIGISNSRGSFDESSSPLICQKCSEKFEKLDAVEAHHLSKHAVTELVEGDSSRRIVEMICRTNGSKSETERVLKVHSMQKTLARFEEYREIVKIKATKLPKKHPRCLADGNELLRFHGTTVACSLGINGSSSLCTLDKCGVCQILRHGLSTNKNNNCGFGIFTTSTSERALESVELDEGNQSIKKALIVCRVIAGRVHRPLENIQQMAGQSGFDSVSGKVGLYSNIEELYLLNHRALLPCFVVTANPESEREILKSKVRLHL